MRNNSILMILGILAMWFGLMLARIAGMPDFLSGLVFGAGAGALFVFVWRNGRRGRGSDPSAGPSC